MRKAWCSNYGSGSTTAAATTDTINFIGSPSVGYATETDGRLRRNSLIVCAICWDADPGTVTPPSGWVEQEKRAFNTGSAWLGFYTRVTGNSEPTNRIYTFNWVNSTQARSLAWVVEHANLTSIFKTGAGPTESNRGGNISGIISDTYSYNAGELGIGVMFADGTFSQDFIDNYTFADANMYKSDGDHDLLMSQQESVASVFPGTQLLSTGGTPNNEMLTRFGQAKSSVSMDAIAGTLSPVRNWMNFHLILNPGAPTVDDASGDDTWNSGDTGIVVNGLDFL